jgi:hypothetical protein
MERQDYVNLLRQSDDSYEDEDSITEKDHVIADKSDKQRAGDKNQYSNDFLSKYINHLGFQSEEVPQFTEMAKKLNLPIVYEDVKKDLTKLDNHDIIKDVSPSKKADDLDMKKQALKKLILKYKGQ